MILPDDRVPVDRRISDVRNTSSSMARSKSCVSNAASRRPGAWLPDLVTQVTQGQVIRVVLPEREVLLPEFAELLWDIRPPVLPHAEPADLHLADIVRSRVILVFQDERSCTCIVPVVPDQERPPAATRDPAADWQDRKLLSSPASAT